MFADDTQDVAETQEKAGLKEECIEFYDKVQLLAKRSKACLCSETCHDTRIAIATPTRELMPICACL